jgi:polyisoprenoid-binding protein YceI
VRRWWWLIGAVVAVATPPWSGALAAPSSAPAPAGVERYVIDPAESQASYRVGEVFIDQGNQFHVAVGTTHAIQGEIFIDRANPRRSRVGAITVDISQLKSDRSGRDRRIRSQWLESERFPLAVFTPAQIQGLPEAYAPGREIAVQIVGDLKIRDVTRPATFATKLRLDGATLTGIATTTIHMTDFGFDPPSILGILRAENEARLEFQFLARHAQ